MSPEEETPQEAAERGAGAASPADAEPEPGDERLRVLRMLAEGKITAEEAEELLRALETEQPAGAAGPFEPRGPFGPAAPFIYRGSFRPGGAVAIVGQRGAVGPDVMLHWDQPVPPAAPAPPVPPAAPVPPASPASPSPPAPPVPPVPPGAHRSARAAERSLEFSVKDGDKEFSAALPMALAASAERFLPRSIQHYLKRFEVDLATLLEVARATDDEAITLDGPSGTGRLQLFHAKDEPVELIVTLTRPWPRGR